MDCIKAGTLSHISRICLNDEPVTSDDRPHATLAWARNRYPPNISFYPSGASTMKCSGGLAHGNTVWTAPPPGIIKINVDAALFRETNESATALVARDEFGTVLEWRSHRCRGHPLAVEVEALAVLKAVEMAIDRGWKRVMIESDNLLIIHALNRNEEDFSSVGNIVHECHSLAANF